MDARPPAANLAATQGQAAESQAPASEPLAAVQIDPAASAALADAIRTAREGRKPAAASADNDAAAPAGALPALRHRSPLIGQVAAAAVLIAAGWLASYSGTLANRDTIRQIETEAARSHEILARLDSDLAALKRTLAAARDVEQTSSTTSAADQAKLAETVERLTVSLQSPSPKLAALESRLDRMESQILASLAGLSAKPAAAPAPSAEAPARDGTPSPKAARAEPLDGWVLREVYRGAALVEGQNRRLYEAVPGGVIPGAGRVEAIERRGASWVVLTDKGVIDAYR